MSSSLIISQKGWTLPDQMQNNNNKKKNGKQKASESGKTNLEFDSWSFKE